MKDRIKYFRKEKKLTQQAFADEMCVSKPTIESYEYGRVEIPERFVKSMVLKYNLREEWLLYGTGEMYAPTTADSDLAEITVNIYNRTDISEDAKKTLLEIVNVAAQMSEEQVNVLIALGQKLATIKKPAD